MQVSRQPPTSYAWSAMRSALRGSRLSSYLVIALAVALAGHYIYLLYSRVHSGSSFAARHTPVHYNQTFIEGLYSRMDEANPDTIFDLVLLGLPDHVQVYPTENYYYFQLNLSGKTFWGNLRLDARDRDYGVLHLGYFTYDETGRFQDVVGIQKSYASTDGVTVSRIDDFTYSVIYRDKTHIFHLNRIGISQPQRMQLALDEHFVGNIFDESGLKFALVYLLEENHFMYVLNEDEDVPETLEEDEDGMTIGKRTGYAFYNDQSHSRKILIAVHGRNWERNNYYDGPFDQLPDNYAARTDLRTYIERAYPYTAGNIDQFGTYTDQPGARVLIAPYYVYYHEEDLDFVRSCGTSLSGAAFYACITPDFYQQSQ